MSDASTREGPSELSLLVIQLFKGPLYRTANERLWAVLGRLRRG